MSYPDEPDDDTPDSSDIVKGVLIAFALFLIGGGLLAIYSLVTGDWPPGLRAR